MRSGWTRCRAQKSAGAPRGPSFTISFRQRAPGLGSIPAPALFRCLRPGSIPAGLHLLQKAFWPAVLPDRCQALRVLFCRIFQKFFCFRLLSPALVRSLSVQVMMQSKERSEEGTNKREAKRSRRPEKGPKKLWQRCRYGGDPSPSPPLLIFSRRTANIFR